MSSVVRCPSCDAATWDVHCEEVNCGWVVCQYCEGVIYDWAERQMMRWRPRPWP